MYFEMAKCSYCHSGDYYTDMKRHDVGSGLEEYKGLNLTLQPCAKFGAQRHISTTEERARYLKCCGNSIKTINMGTLPI